MKRRLRIVLLWGVMLLVTSGIVMAQPAAKTFCGDLSKADCTLLTDAEALNNKLDSHSFKLDLKVDASDLPAMPITNLNFHFAGKGTVIIDHKGMPDFNVLDMTTPNQDPKALFNLISQAATHLSTDVQLVLEIPKELKPMLANAKYPDAVNLDLRLVDGTIYVNVAKLAPFIPQAKSLPAWIGMNIPDLISAMLKQPSFANSLSGTSSSMNADISSKFTALYTDPKTVAKFLKVKRIADATFESHKVAVFETTIDFPAMFAMPEMMQIFTDQAGGSSGKLSDSQKKSMMEVLQTAGQALHFTMTRSIDLEQKYIYQTDATVNFDLSFAKSAFNSAMVFNFKVLITQGDFNRVAAIKAPEGAVVIPAESVISSQ